MKTTLVNKEQYQTTEWAGGNSTEIFIYPFHTSYKDRNFSIRISTAIIERFESEFTHLPGIHRKLTVLSGALLIEHPAHHTTLLLAYDTDTFEGDWNTKCKGTGTDFNVMTHREVRSEVKVLEIESGQTTSIPVESKTKLIHFYLPVGEAILSISDKAFKLSEGMSLVIEENDTQFDIRLQSKAGCVILLSEFKNVS